MIIDMQMIMQSRIDAGRDHVNHSAPDNIHDLAMTFRAKEWPIIHIRHSDDHPGSPLHPAAPGHPPMQCAHALPGEPIFYKSTSSAFASTNLDTYLRNEGITELVVTGAVAGFCVNSTIRAGCDLGFKMIAIRDAILGFDLPLANLSASTIFDVTMAHLEADFATVLTVSSFVSVNVT